MILLVVLAMFGGMIILIPIVIISAIIVVGPGLADSSQEKNHEEGAHSEPDFTGWPL